MRLILLGLVLVFEGVAIAASEMPSEALVDVTPGQSAGVYSDTAQSDAEAEGQSADVFTVTAPDGTTTENHLRSDDTVWGIVTTPDGESFTFGIEEDDPEWNCQTMGNRVCGGN